MVLDFVLRTIRSRREDNEDEEEDAEAHRDDGKKWVDKARKICHGPALQVIVTVHRTYTDMIVLHAGNIEAAFSPHVSVEEIIPSLYRGSLYYI